jgi:hypothetical protein
LLELYERFVSRLNPLIENIDGDWPRKADLLKHRGFIRRNLDLGDRSSSAVDARDIVFFDMPALADYLLIQAAQ